MPNSRLHLEHATDRDEMGRQTLCLEFDVSRFLPSFQILQLSDRRDYTVTHERRVAKIQLRQTSKLGDKFFIILQCFDVHLISIRRKSQMDTVVLVVGNFIFNREIL